MLETKYILDTPISYRKELGQFFTPPVVANLMAKWVMQNPAKKILDPAFGLGVFYDEITKIDTSGSIQFTGYEIDERIINFLNYDGNKENLNIINEDYLEVDTDKFDAVICNPPYMRFQNFLNRHNILPKIQEKMGKRLTGHSNISSVFLIKAIQELNVNGRLAFIMPFEFFNTGYGKEIKKSLLEEHLLKQIVIFLNEKEIFPDATTTICILLCKKDGKANSIKITSIRNKDEINNLSDIGNFYQHELTASDLSPDKKWTPIISALYSEQKIPDKFCKVSQYGVFKRGIATGANEFFALAKSKIKELQLNANDICKCITKSPQIKKAVFTEDDFDVLYNSDKPVYCLDVKDEDNQSIRNYLKEGEQEGLHKRYLTMNRKPWYKIENRQPAPILFGVFNRGRLKVIRNYSTAINFTCFHSFYPNLFGINNVDKLFAYFLSDKGQDIIKMNKRSYGNNLDKLEPGDLNDCLCPNQNQLNSIKEEDIKEIVEIAKTDEKLAIDMCNKLVDNIV